MFLFLTNTPALYLVKWILEKENNEILFLKRLSYHNMEYLSIIPLKGKLKSRAIFKCVLGFPHECCTLNFSYSN